MTESHDSVWADRGRPPQDRRSGRISRRLVAALVGGVVALAVAAVALIAALSDSKHRNERAVATAQKRLEATERARLLREGKPRFASGPARRPGEDPLHHRARVVGAAEALITADARARVKTGELHGAVKGTDCRGTPLTPKRADQEADPSVVANRYQCIAFTRRFPLSKLEGEDRRGVIGQPYLLVVRYRTAKLTYCKEAPRPGEGGGKPLAQVPVDPACQDPLRRG